jgi:hypothetical protein
MATLSGRRDRLASLLACAAAVLFVLAGASWYVSNAILDADKFADRATAALEDDAVRKEIATVVTDELVLRADPDLVAARPIIEGALAELIGGSAFQSIHRAALNDVYRALIDHDQNTVTLTLADIGTLVRGAVQALAPRAARQIPADADASIRDIELPSAVTDVLRTAHELRSLATVLAILAALLAVVALWRASNRRLVLMRLGIAVAVSAALAVIALNFTRGLVLAAIDETAIRDAAAGVWSAFLGDLARGLLVLAACGAIVAAAASSLLRPLDATPPLRRAWELATATPSNPWLRAIRALGLVAIGALIVLAPVHALELVAIVAGLFIAYAGVAELLRLTMAVDPAERAAETRRARRSLVVGAATVALVALVAGAFTFGGGFEERFRQLDDPGCNGSEDICERRLDQIAIPATHNSMSAATNRGWLFAQQDAGIAEQLEDGIRGFLIDAHYGEPTQSGTIKTSLEGKGAKERKKFAETLGEDGFNAALRIRDRIVDSPVTGKRGVYFCHAFCELGALPIDTVFEQFRDFLAANPREVLVIVIEDYVHPEDIAAAAERTGLVDLIYKGDPADGIPRVQEMIDENQRVLLMAENDAGDVPYYHQAYDGLVEETPYSFKQVPELTDRDRLRASCKPNRGREGSPFFLMNHWIDTSPAPKPSNAAQVNARSALEARIAECERVRERRPGLIAVDFYREGDLFDVARDLNRRPAPTAAG